MLALRKCFFDVGYHGTPDPALVAPDRPPSDLPGCPLAQGFSTPGPRTGNGPWLNQHRAAQELISYFCFIYYLSLEHSGEEENIKYKCKFKKKINCGR